MSIVWKKKVEAGILLYALLMVAIFSLVLAFYLNRQVATQRNLVLEREKVAAYALASLSQKEGTSSNIGTSQVKADGDVTKVEVSLKTGRSYQFSFPKAKEEEKKDEKEAEKKETKEEKAEQKEDKKDETKNQQEAGQELSAQVQPTDSSSTQQDNGNSPTQP